MRFASSAAGVAVLFAPLAAAAQTEIGLPPSLRFSAGGYASAWGTAPAAALLGAGVYRDLLNPAAGILGVQGEAYGGASRDGEWLAHVALGARSPALALGAGIDVALRDADFAAYISVMHPLRRGGLLSRGSLLHASVLFGSENRLRAGIAVPLGQPLVGGGRPRDHVVTLRATRSSFPAHNELHDLVLQMHDVILPPVTRPGAARVALQDRNAVNVIAAYHDTLDRMLGREVADSLRAVLLDSLLLPHNRLLGRKREPDDLSAFATPTLAAARSLGVRATATAATIISALQQASALQRDRHGDERLVWLPLQFALRTEQYATQAQLDALIERATAGEFSDSNHVVYVNNEQFAWELFHSIRDARNYHVLWVHTFRGVNAERTADAVSFRHVAHSYLAGLIDRVRRYDSERILPDYQILLDQFYFEQNRGRIWMPLLQDPLGARIRLRNAPASWQTTLDSLQHELHAAVAASQLLQAEARARGERWLRDRVSVRVHITQQADPSFFSADIVPVIGLSDNALRDHRKIVFYDLTETDPYRGAMIISGMGVGEEFSGEDWEDRAAILSGAVTHTVKRHAARVLTGNGLAPEELPVWLQESQDTVPLAQRASAPRFDPIAVTALQLHNDAGYGEKQVTVATAMLYSLLPPGSVVKSVNALFLNPLWASLLLGHSLRGGQVLLMSASRENSPFKQPEMSLAAEMLAHMLAARDTLATALGRSGGMLRVGVYDVDLAVDDMSARIDTALARRARTPWLQELEPFSREVVDSLRRVAAELRRADSGRRAEKRPKLHMKAQFIASQEAWENLFVQPGWGAALATYFRGVSQLAERRPQYADFHLLPPTTVTQTRGAFALRQEVMSQNSERDLYYLMLGSFNQDYRSALLDGEAMILISQFGAAVGVADFVLLPSLCTWVESAAELHRYMPARVGWFTRALRKLY